MLEYRHQDFAHHCNVQCEYSTVPVTLLEHLRVPDLVFVSIGDVTIGATTTDYGTIHLLFVSAGTGGRSFLGVISPRYLEGRIPEVLAIILVLAVLILASRALYWTARYRILIIKCYAWPLVRCDG